MDEKNIIWILINWTPELFLGFFNNLLISISAMVIGTLFGLCIVFLRSSSKDGISSAGRGITNLVRNVPSFVLMFYLAFILPSYIEFGSLQISISPLVKASVALVLPVAGFTSDALMGVLRTKNDKDINPYIVLWSSWWSYFVVVLMASSTASVIGVDEIVSKGNLLIASLGNSDFSLLVYVYITFWFLVAGLFFTGIKRYLTIILNRSFFKKAFKMSVLTLILFSVSSSDLLASEVKRDDVIDRTKTYKIAVRYSPPFVIKDKYGNLDGISIDLWETIAKTLDIKYEYRFISFTETLDSLKNGTVDIAISPLTITREREKVFDFSNQYFPSGLTFASITKSSVNFDYAVENLLKVLSSPYILTFLIVFIFLFILFMIFSLMNFNKYAGSEIDKKTGKTEKVISFSIITLLMTVGIDKGIFRFRSVFMQIFSLLLIFFGITVSASTFGLITATLTQSINYQPEYDMNSIDFKRIAVMKGSTADKYLSLYKKENKLVIVKKANPLGTVSSLLHGEADLIFGDWAQLKYWANQNENIHVQNSFLRFEPYGWGFPDNSTIREPVNQELIFMIRQKEWWKQRVKKYLGSVSLLSLK